MSLPADNDPVIAGNLKASDWRAFRATLTVGGEPRRWKEAFRLYFHQRLELRYLGPIKVLQDNGTFLGEGFAIAAIQCSLVEFLAATVEGKSYVHGKKPDPDTEYRFSGEMIERFLTTAHPFLHHFNAASAKEFYTNIRCGLLHEAAMKNGWRIFASSLSGGELIDSTKRVLYRDDFQKALLAFVSDYGEQLKADTSLQAAFIRKFDGLSA